MKISMSNQKRTDVAIKNLEMQVGQLSKQLVYQHKGTYFENTQDNQKENCKYVITHSGRKIDMGVGDEVEEEEIVVEKEKEKDEIEVEKNIEGELVENRKVRKKKEKRKIERKRRKRIKRGRRS